MIFWRSVDHVRRQQELLVGHRRPVSLRHQPIRLKEKIN
jgi:hypothetical protein